MLITDPFSLNVVKTRGFRAGSSRDHRRTKVCTLKPEIAKKTTNNTNKNVQNAIDCRRLFDCDSADRTELTRL